MACLTDPRGSIVTALLGKERELTSIAPDTDQLQELDAEIRQAWAAYTERLRELSGAEYERIESECWDELQTELRRLENARESLTASASET
jgi:hypothetical protein